MQLDWHLPENDAHLTGMKESGDAVVNLMLRVTSSSMTGLAQISQSVCQISCWCSGISHICLLEFDISCVTVKMLECLVVHQERSGGH